MYRLPVEPGCWTPARHLTGCIIGKQDMCPCFFCTSILYNTPPIWGCPFPAERIIGYRSTRPSFLSGVRNRTIPFFLCQAVSRFSSRPCPASGEASVGIWCCCSLRRNHSKATGSRPDSRIRNGPSATANRRCSRLWSCRAVLPPAQNPGAGNVRSGKPPNRSTPGPMPASPRRLRSESVAAGQPDAILGSIVIPLGLSAAFSPPRSFRCRPGDRVSSSGV
jgi:hypothetical protein